jgi:hypothetical protein
MDNKGSALPSVYYPHSTVCLKETLKGEMITIFLNHKNIDIKYKYKIDLKMITKYEKINYKL